MRTGCLSKRFGGTRRTAALTVVVALVAGFVGGLTGSVSPDGVQAQAQTVSRTNPNHLRVKPPGGYKAP